VGPHHRKNDERFYSFPNMKSHTRRAMILGDGGTQASSTKQKVSSRTSTEAELISMDDILSKVI
jgi:TnpA family transposase